MKINQSYTFLLIFKQGYYYTVIQNKGLNIKMLTQKNQQRLEPIRFLDYNFKIRSQLLDPLVKKHSSSDSNLLKKSGTRENSPASEKQEYSGRQRINMDY